MSTQCCGHCGWNGPARVYNLVWTHEWVCPHCMQPSRATMDCGKALVDRLRHVAVGGDDPRRRARAASLAASLASVIAGPDPLC